MFSGNEFQKFFGGGGEESPPHGSSMKKGQPRSDFWLDPRLLMHGLKKQIALYFYTSEILRSIVNSTRLNKRQHT